jgi:CheY-like chemotaxis protein
MGKSSRRLRVLVADDDFDEARSLAALLRSHGHDVLCVKHGADVLGTVAGYAPDALLVDIGLPQHNGYEIARMLRERYGSARPLIVALSGREAGDVRAPSGDFDGQVTKPLESQKLLAALCPLLR